MRLLFSFYRNCIFFCLSFNFLCTFLVENVDSLIQHVAYFVFRFTLLFFNSFNFKFASILACLIIFNFFSDFVHSFSTYVSLHLKCLNKAAFVVGSSLFFAVVLDLVLGVYIYNLSTCFDLFYYF